MYSIKVLAPDQTLCVGDSLSVDVEIDNGLSHAEQITLDCKLTINGVTSDVSLPYFEKAHICQPGKTTIQLFPPFEITRAFPHGSYYITVEATPPSGETFIGSLYVDIDGRLNHPVRHTFYRSGTELPEWIVYGHYGLLCGADAGEGFNFRSMAELRNVVDQVASRWPKTLAFRCWVIGERRDQPTVWNKQGDKHNLESYNSAYINRVAEFCNYCASKNVFVVLDLFDHYTMYKGELWDGHLLHPNHNVQQTYGQPMNISAFPGWYNLSDPNFKNFQRTYVQKIARAVKDNPYVIISTGNEMVEGDHATRKAWHIQICKWVHEISPSILTTENDYDWSDDLHAHKEVDMVSIHALDGVVCDGPDGWHGAPNWNSHTSKFNKPVLLDNDGLWVCRDDIDTIVAWYQLVKATSGIYGCKGPFPGDERWASFGIPMLQALSNVA